MHELLTTLLILLVLVVVGFAAYVRLAPVKPEQWNQPIAADVADRKGTGQITRLEGGATAHLSGLNESPAAVLTRLDRIALDTPRTERIAGTPEAGLMTWQTRSAFWGFPDYTTAEAQSGPGGTELFLSARLRFGKSDFGVNAARLEKWIAELTGGAG